MFKYTVLLLSIVLFITSCSEQKPPGIDLGGLIKAVDSSYVAPVEAKQDRVVLIEELTGVDCANCPRAAREIKTISDANPGKVLSVGMHPPSSGYTEPIFGKSKYTFRNDKVDEVMIKLGGLTAGLPSACINRIPLATNEMFEGPGAWINRVTPLLSKTTPLNIGLESVYQADNNLCEVVTKVSFTEDVMEDLYLTVYVFENNIVDYQKDGLDLISDYKHQHVFRDCITSVAGTSLNFADKNAGTVLQKRIEFNPIIEGVNGWNLDNCKILAFVHKSGTDQSVLHAQEISLK